MKRNVLQQTATAFALGAFVLTAQGCMNDSSTAPEDDTPDTTNAPTLPDADRLSFDFDFFDEPQNNGRCSNDSFFNAYIRTVVVAAVSELVLAPPVGAFALALHTPPSPQNDGSYLWIYTWTDGVEEAQIRLRGLPIENGAEWELRVSSTEDQIENELWFAGETRDDGDQGYFVFSDFHAVGKPDVARLEWGTENDAEFLRFTDLHENVDDTLEFRNTGDTASFRWTDASHPAESWYVNWNEADGSGQMQAPDFNGGEPACWDDDKCDTDCEIAS